MKQRAGLASTVIVAVFLAMLVVGVLGRMIFSEAWHYTYAMGVTGLLLRLLGYCLLLSLPILAILWERGPEGSNRRPVRSTTTTAIGADGKVLYRNTRQVSRAPHRPQKNRPGAASLSVSVCCIVLVGLLGILPTVMDLFSQPVTEELYFVVRYSRNTTRGSGPGRYYLLTYHESGEPVTIGSWRAVSLRANMQFSSYETIRSGSGAIEVSFPPNRYGNRPPNGEYALFSATVTYYPRSRTRVGFENVRFYLPEDFPPARPERTYYGPVDL